jgi:hypothetical protein
VTPGSPRPLRTRRPHRPRRRPPRPSHPPCLGPPARAIRPTLSPARWTAPEVRREPPLASLPRVAEGRCPRTPKTVPGRGQAAPEWDRPLIRCRLNAEEGRGRLKERLGAAVGDFLALAYLPPIGALLHSGPCLPDSGQSGRASSLPVNEATVT